MKCFNHHDRDAFGICKACGKALCLECLKETNSGLVCKDNSRCEEILAIADYSYDVMKKAAYSKKRKWLTFFAGLAFLICGLLSVQIKDMLMTFMGFAMIFLGILFMLSSRSLGKNLKKQK